MILFPSASVTVRQMSKASHHCSNFFLQRCYLFSSWEFFKLPKSSNLNFDTSNDTYIYTYTILSWISDIWFYPNSEFLNVTVSRLCDRAKFSWLWATFWDWYFETKNLCILTYSTVFSSWFTHNMWFLMWLLHFFLPTNFRTKVLTAQKFYF